MNIFILVVSIVWFAAHYYVGRRMIQTTSMRPSFKIASWIIGCAGSLSFITAMMMRFHAKTPIWFEPIKYFGYVWCGFFVMLLILTIVRDIIYGVSVVYARISETYFDGKKHDDLEDPMRRHLFSTAVTASIAAAATTSTGIGFYEATKIPDLKPVDVFLDNLPSALDGFKIVQLSDIHVGPMVHGEYLRQVVERVNSVGADMVALTGDFIDGYVDQLRNETKYLSNVKAKHGLFYCPGNHEYYWDGPGWCKEVARLGGTVLVDTHTLIEHNGAKILVAGVADYSRKGRGMIGHESSPKKAKEGAPPHDLSILLAHQPKSVWEASSVAFDLQLSGHTHGGQFWPWNYIVGLAHPLAAGLGTFDKTTLYVSRGTGYWGPPNRFMVPSEITVLTLRSKKQQSV